MNVFSLKQPANCHVILLHLSQAASYPLHLTVRWIPIYMSARWTNLSAVTPVRPKFFDCSYHVADNRWSTSDTVDELFHCSEIDSRIVSTRLCRSVQCSSNGATELNQLARTVGHPNSVILPETDKKLRWWSRNRVWTWMCSWGHLWRPHSPATLVNVGGAWLPRLQEDGVSCNQVMMLKIHLGLSHFLKPAWWITYSLWRQFWELGGWVLCRKAFVMFRSCDSHGTIAFTVDQDAFNLQ